MDGLLGSTAMYGSTCVSSCDPGGPCRESWLTCTAANSGGPSASATRAATRPAILYSANPRTWRIGGPERSHSPLARSLSRRFPRGAHRNGKRTLLSVGWESSTVECSLHHQRLAGLLRF